MPNKIKLCLKGHYCKVYQLTDVILIRTSAI